jgi:tetratricopeptide (TPR) repeat protein
MNKVQLKLVNLFYLLKKTPLIVLLVFLCGESLKAENKGMDQDLQVLKQGILEIDSDLLIQEERLKNPLVIYLSMEVDRRFKLEDLYLQLNGRDFKHQSYEKKDLKILRKGYAQLVFTGELAVGEHELIAYYLSSKDHSSGSKFHFNKTASANFVEISIKKHKSKESRFNPELTIREIDLQEEKKKLSDSIFFRNLKYMEEEGRTSQLVAQVMKNRKLGRVKSTTEEYRLLLGKLYLSMDMYLQASKVFESLSKEESISPRMSNEIWFFLAKSYFYLDKIVEARQAIKNAKEPLGENVRAEKQHILSLMYMANGEYEEASNLMRDNWDQALGQWNLYARYNFSVALIGNGKVEEGLELLKQTGYMETDVDDKEATAVIDKVNQVLGLYYLKKKDALLARQYFEKVSLNGSFSNIALLGAGWANATLDDYKKALIPWGELIKRDKRDVTVQESMLVVPYAYEQIGAWKLASDYYQKAIEVYTQEIIKIEDSIAAISENKLQKEIDKLSFETKNSWLRSLNVAINNVPALYHMKQLMKNNEFFQIMHNYRESRFLIIDISQQVSVIDYQRSEKVTGGTEMVNKLSKIHDDKANKLNFYNKRAEEHAYKYGKQLNNLALELLEKKKKKIYLYLTQARLALAQSYNSVGER